MTEDILRELAKAVEVANNSTVHIEFHREEGRKNFKVSIQGSLVNVYSGLCFLLMKFAQDSGEGDAEEAVGYVKDIARSVIRAIREEQS